MITANLSFTLLIFNLHVYCLLFIDIGILYGFVKIINYKLYSFFFYFLLLFFFPLILPVSTSFSIHLFFHFSRLHCFLSFSSPFSLYWVFLTFSMFSSLPLFLSPTILFFFKCIQFLHYSFIIVLFSILYYFVPSLCSFSVFLPPFIILFFHFWSRTKSRKKK